MDRVFVDTNVAIDYLIARLPFDQDANLIFNRAAVGQIQLCISTLSICNIAYTYRKLQPNTDVSQILTDLCALTMLTPINASTISAALQSNFKDFEDAVQHFSAFDFGGVTHLVTRNPKDFAQSLLPVFTPSQYLAL